MQFFFKYSAIYLVIENFYRSKLYAASKNAIDTIFFNVTAFQPINLIIYMVSILFKLPISKKKINK